MAGRNEGREEKGIQDKWVAGRREHKGVKTDNEGDRATKERRDVESRTQEREAPKMGKTRVRHQNKLAHQAQTDA
jgi:hypothetical protein